MSDHRRQLKNTKTVHPAESDLDLTASQKKGRQAYHWTLIVTGIMMLFVLVGLIISYSIYSPEEINQLMASAQPWFPVWRLLLFIILIGGWRYGSLWYALWAGLSEEQLAIMINYRWRMALWLCVMEVVLVQGVLAEFVNNIISTESSSL